ncbi:MAG: SDR family oxidoreductase [Candidatus Sericytochromatia bacterium]|nr:SDR family oxidoreductase [Candidatus Sericytochromatia bacterium]
MNVNFQDQRILVTGASAGIGRELALQLAEKGPKCLILTARREQMLVELQAEIAQKQPGLKVLIHACDLAEQSEIDGLLYFISREAGAVDILINNAGMGDYGLFENSSWKKTEQILRLNIEALTYLTHKLVGPMIALKRGAILNVSSGLGFFFMPGMSVYAATKHYVTAFTEALRIELKGTGVVISQLCPGPVVSEFAQVAGNSDLLAKAPSGAVIGAEQCAREALMGFAKGQAVIVPGDLIRIATVLGQLVPRPLLRWVLASTRGRMVRRGQTPEQAPEVAKA